MEWFFFDWLISQQGERRTSNRTPTKEDTDGDTDRNDP